MTRKSLIQRNLKRMLLFSKLANKRYKLKKKIGDKSLPLKDRFSIQKELFKLPRNSTKIRIRNRCIVTGRGRGVYSKFMLSRICIRLMASNNQLPGVRKSSW